MCRITNLVGLQTKNKFLCHQVIELTPSHEFFHLDQCFLVSSGNKSFFIRLNQKKSVLFSLETTDYKKNTKNSVNLSSKVRNKLVMNVFRTWHNALAPLQGCPSRPVLVQHL